MTDGMQLTSDNKQLDRIGVPQLTELVDPEILQQVQGLLAFVFRMNMVVYDATGTRITEPSLENTSCPCPQSPEKCTCYQDLKTLPVDPQDFTQIRRDVCSDSNVRYLLPIMARDGLVAVVVVTYHQEAESVAQPPQPVSERLRLLLPDVSPTTGPAQGAEVAFQYQVGLVHYLLTTLVQVGLRAWELGGSVKEMTKVNELTKLFVSTVELPEVLDRVARTVTEALQAKACSLRLLDKTRNALEIRATYGLSKEYLAKGPVLVKQSRIDVQALEGSTVLVSDVSTDPRILYPAEMARENIKSLLCAGIRSKDRAFGVIRVYDDRTRQFNEGDVSLLEAIANTAAIAIENAILFEQNLERRRMQAELSVASRIQQELLPEQVPQVPHVDMAVAYKPTEKVGGDFYDFIRIGSDHIGVAIGDGLGKGVPGAILMATAKTALRAWVENAYSTQEIMTSVNRSLTQDRVSLTRSFVTLFYGAIDFRRGLFTFTNAGHNPPLLFRQDTYTELHTGGIVLGVSPGAEYAEKQLMLRRGDLLVLYTDGVTEAMDIQDEVFGRGRLIEMVRANTHLGAQELLGVLLEELEEHRGGRRQSDDLTVIIVRVIEDFS